MDKVRITEIKVGVFAIVGLFIFAFLIITFGFKSSELVDTYPVTVSFRYTNGVVLGAPVRFAGVEVGIVDSIQFEKVTDRVLLNLKINEKIKIRDDARIIINSLGIMGEKYVEFIPTANRGKIVKKGVVLVGEDPTALGDIMEKGINLVDKVADQISEILSPEAIESFHNILENVDQLTGQETKDKIVTILDQFQELSDPVIKEEIINSLDNIQSMVDLGKNFLNNIDKLSEEELKSLLVEAKEFFIEMEEVSKSIKEVTTALSDVLSAVDTQKGSIGKLIYEKEFHEKLVVVLNNFNDLVLQLKRKGLLYKGEKVSKRQSKNMRR